MRIILLILPLILNAQWLTQWYGKKILLVPDSLVTKVDILPNADNLYNLGSSNLRWKNIYIAGDMTVDSLGVRHLSVIDDGDTAIMFLPDTLLYLFGDKASGVYIKDSLNANKTTTGLSVNVQNLYKSGTVTKRGGYFVVDTGGLGAKYGIDVWTKGGQGDNLTLYGVRSIAEVFGTSTDNNMYGGWFQSNACGGGKKTGIYGEVGGNSADGDTSRGVWGKSIVELGGSGSWGFGGYFESVGDDNDTCMGVLGKASGGTVNIGGQFDPNLYVLTGTDTTKITGTKIESDSFVSINSTDTVVVIASYLKITEYNSSAVMHDSVYQDVSTFLWTRMFPDQFGYQRDVVRKTTQFQDSLCMNFFVSRYDSAGGTNGGWDPCTIFVWTNVDKTTGTPTPKNEGIYKIFTNSDETVDYTDGELGGDLMVKGTGVTDDNSRNYSGFTVYDIPQIRLWADGWYWGAGDVPGYVELRVTPGFDDTVFWKVGEVGGNHYSIYGQAKDFKIQMSAGGSDEDTSTFEFADRSGTSTRYWFFTYDSNGTDLDTTFIRGGNIITNTLAADSLELLNKLAFNSGDTFSLYASNDTFFIDAKHDAGYLDLSELTVLFKPGWMEFDQIKPATNDSSSSSIGWSNNPYGTGYFIDLYVDSIHGFSPVKICDKTTIQHESATSDTALIITLDTLSGGGSVEHTGIKMNGTAFSISQYFLKFYDRDDNLKFFVRGDGKLYSGNDVVSNSFFAYNDIEVQDDCEFGSDSTDTVGIYGDLTVQEDIIVKDTLFVIGASGADSGYTTQNGTYWWFESDNKFWFNQEVRINSHLYLPYNLSRLRMEGFGIELDYSGNDSLCFIEFNDADSIKYDSISRGFEMTSKLMIKDTLFIIKSDSAGLSPDDSGDDLVIKDDTSDCGITLFSGAGPGDYCAINFGNKNNAKRGYISYQAQGDVMFFATTSVRRFQVSSSACSIFVDLGVKGDITSIVGTDTTIINENGIYSSSSPYWYCKYMDAFSLSSGGSGATLVTPDGNTLGGYNLDSDNEYLYFNAAVCNNWNGTSDPIVIVIWETDVDNTGGGVNDSVEIDLQCWFKGEGETSNKTQALSERTEVGQSARYKQFLTTFTIDHDDGSNPVEEGDVFTFRLNFDATNSDISDIMINFVRFGYRCNVPNPKAY